MGTTELLFIFKHKTHKYVNIYFTDNKPKDTAVSLAYLIVCNCCLVLLKLKTHNNVNKYLFFLYIVIECLLLINNVGKICDMICIYDALCWDMCFVVLLSF